MRTSPEQASGLSVCRSLHVDKGSTVTYLLPVAPTERLLFSSDPTLQSCGNSSVQSSHWTERTMQRSKSRSLKDARSADHVHAHPRGGHSLAQSHVARQAVAHPSDVEQLMEPTRTEWRRVPCRPTNPLRISTGRRCHSGYLRGYCSITETTTRGCGGCITPGRHPPR
jgi:hypothetical protein